MSVALVFVRVLVVGGVFPIRIAVVGFVLP